MAKNDTPAPFIGSARDLRLTDNTARLAASLQAVGPSRPLSTFLSQLGQRAPMDRAQAAAVPL